MWLIVSPVASAAAMIVVPSIRPDDDQRACEPAGGARCAARAGRSTRLRSASTATTAERDARAGHQDDAGADRDAEELAHGRPAPIGERGRVGDADVVGLAARAASGRWSRTSATCSRVVAAAARPASAAASSLQKVSDERLALGVVQDVAALVAVLLVEAPA